jgi:hypothetical protein
LGKVGNREKQGQLMVDRKKEILADRCFYKMLESDDDKLARKTKKFINPN